MTSSTGVRTIGKQQSRRDRPGRASSVTRWIPEVRDISRRHRTSPGRRFRSALLPVSAQSQTWRRDVTQTSRGGLFPGWEREETAEGWAVGNPIEALHRACIVSESIGCMIAGVDTTHTHAIDQRRHALTPRGDHYASAQTHWLMSNFNGYISCQRSSRLSVILVRGDIGLLLP